MFTWDSQPSAGHQQEGLHRNVGALCSGGTAGTWQWQHHQPHAEPGQWRGRAGLAESPGRRALRVQFSQESLRRYVGDSWKYCS